jgi:hypothetical protein
VELQGFKKENRKDIALIVNSSTRVDIQLTPGNVTETVEVSGAPPLLQTDRADTGAKLETIQTASLPLGTNRNYQSLLNLVPGTTRATFQRRNSSTQRLAADRSQRSDAHGTAGDGQQRTYGPCKSSCRRSGVRLSGCRFGAEFRGGEGGSEQSFTI